MYEWLTKEIASIQTRKFHIVEPFSTELRKAVENAKLPVPPSYKTFLFEVGDAKLYRRGSYYLIEVFRVPNEIQSEDGEWLLQLGRTEKSLAYFKEALLQPGKESPVFEWWHNVGIRKSADSFEEWLTNKCRAARRRIKKHEWEAVQKGPPPFDEREKAIVKAREKFEWAMTGIAENGDIEFKVHNASDLVLPFLSIGIKGENGEVDGGIWLPVSTVLPGETRVIQKGCYKEVLPPSQVVAFALPPPEPEDRDQYWEFR